MKRKLKEKKQEELERKKNEKYQEYLKNLGYSEKTKNQYHFIETNLQIAIYRLVGIYNKEGI